MQGMWAGKDYNERVAKFVMTNQFRDDYKERVEVSGALAKLNFDAMTDEQLSRIHAGEHPYAVLAPSRHTDGPSVVSDGNPEVLVVCGPGWDMDG